MTLADANATTPLLESAQTAFWDAAFSPQKATRFMEQARETLARELGGDPAQWSFFSGGTEANAWALRNAPAGSVCSAMEHPAVVGTLESPKLVTPDEDGVLGVDAFVSEVEGARLASVMLANNETGVIQPVQALAKECQRRGVSLHCDGVQAVGKIPLDVVSLGVDSLAVSGHKFGGPLGVGALYSRDESPAGISNPTGAWAMAQALVGSVKRYEAVGAFRDAFEATLRERVALQVIGERATRLPSTSLIRFPGAEGDGLMMALDLEGIWVSTGSACSSGSIEPSPTLLSMGMSETEAKETVRFSFSPQGLPELEPFVDRVATVVGRLKNGDGSP